MCTIGESMNSLIEKLVFVFLRKFFLELVKIYQNKTILKLNNTNYLHFLEVFFILQLFFVSETVNFKKHWSTKTSLFKTANFRQILLKIIFLVLNFLEIQENNKYKKLQSIFINLNKL